jgi:hypothetical protein
MDLAEKWPGIPPRESHDWHSIKAVARDRWICAVDLGQSHDSTAIAVIHHVVQPLGTYTPNAIKKHWKEDRTTRFDLLHLQRIPLNTDYVTQMHMVRELISREPLASSPLDLVFDQTGVGAAVCDIADAVGLKSFRVVITAGLETTMHGGNVFHVPKATLISKLSAAAHTRELHIADNIMEKEQFRAEMADFQAHISAAGRPTFGASQRSGATDDIVLACAIGVWFCTSRPTSSWEELRI